MKYALKLACIPTVAILGVGIGELMGGAVFVEIIFNRPGLGSLIFDAIRNRNYPIVQGGILVVVAIFVVTNLAVDLSYAWLDPRIREAIGRAEPGRLAADAADFCSGLAKPERQDRADRHVARGDGRSRGAAHRDPFAQPDRRRGPAGAAFGGALAGHRPSRPRPALPRPLRHPDRRRRGAGGDGHGARPRHPARRDCSLCAARRSNALILALFDIISSFPSLILALALVAVLGPGLVNIIILVTIVFVPQFGRVARAQTLSVAQRPFLEAERALGASGPRIVLLPCPAQHRRPDPRAGHDEHPGGHHARGGAVSFLGVGIRPPLASWGSMLFDGFTYLDQSVWPVLVAGGMLTLATLGFTLFGESAARRHRSQAEARAS